MRRSLLLFVFGALIIPAIAAAPKDAMNAVAEKYAHLVLALGQHDPDYVDAFYGPSSAKPTAGWHVTSKGYFGRGSLMLRSAGLIPARRSAIALMSARAALRVSSKIDKSSSRSSWLVAYGL
jgi:hypothetical protein